MTPMCNLHVTSGCHRVLSTAVSHLGMPGVSPAVSLCPHGFWVPGQDQSHPEDSNPVLVTQNVPVLG